MSASSEDILNDALTFFGGEQAVDTEIITYGPLRLTVAPKEGKANTLLADHLFSPSLFLAERIERGLLSVSRRKVVELGAGCALPSLLMSTLPPPAAPSLVVITDYPDPSIINNLTRNIERNKAHFVESCKVVWRGFEWGVDAQAQSLRSVAGDTGFDVVVLSDLLHFHSSHDALVSSLSALLAKSPSSVAYIAAGKYTLPDVCHNFLRVAAKAGFVVVEEDSNADCRWLGRMDVQSYDAEALAVRKAACRYWVARWAAT